MVNRYLSSVIALVLTLMGIASCNKTINTELENRATNEKAFLAFKDSVGYTKVGLPGLGGDNYVYMKWLKRTTQADAPRPAATDRVVIHYRTYVLPDYVQGNRSGSLVDQNYDKEHPAPMVVQGFVSGFSMALQQMQVGDEVEVAVPWYLAYGSGNPSYFFRIKLESIE